LPQILHGRCGWLAQYTVTSRSVSDPNDKFTSSQEKSSSIMLLLLWLLSFGNDDDDGRSDDDRRVWTKIPYRAMCMTTTRKTQYIIPEYQLLCRPATGGRDGGGVTATGSRCVVVAAAGAAADVTQ
jgi:hypothetical protein